MTQFKEPGVLFTSDTPVTQSIHQQANLTRQFTKSNKARRTVQELWVSNAIRLSAYDTLDARVGLTKAESNDQDKERVALLCSLFITQILCSSNNLSRSFDQADMTALRREKKVNTFTHLHTRFYATRYSIRVSSKFR